LNIVLSLKAVKTDYYPYHNRKVTNITNRHVGH